MNTIVTEAESLLHSQAEVLTTPYSHECLACFMARMVDQFGCDCTLRWATRFRDLRSPQATRLERRLGDLGAFCDCELFLNGIREHDDLPDDDVDDESPGRRPPTCAGVARTSTTPCGVWRRR